MILKQAYIKAFGNLKDVSLTFHSNLNSYCEKNGYGKTTISAFIKSMFYGLGSSVSKKKFRERERYLPFSKEECGGSLTFSIDKDIYRIERTFKEKTGEDTCAVYKNNSLLKMEEEVGEHFFKINSESFDKTMFLYPEDLTIASNEDINSKMANYFLNEEMDIDKVISGLSDRKKAYKAMRGDNGLIKDKEREIASLQNEKAELDGKKQILKEAEEKRADILKQIDDKEKECERAKEEEEKRRIYKQIEDSRLEVEKAKKEYEDCLSNDGKGIPSDEEYDEIKYLYSNIVNKENQKESLTLNEKEEYDELTDFFSVSYPSEEKLNEIFDKIHRYDSIKEEDNSYDLEEKRIIGLFENHPFSEEKAEEFKGIKLQLSTCPKTKSTMIVKEGKRNKLFLYIALASFVILSLISFLLGYFVNQICYMLFLLSFSSLFSFLLVFHRSKKEEKEIVTIENEEYACLQKEYSKLEEECKSILKSYGMEKTDISEEFEELKNEYQQYLVFQNVRAEREKRNEKAKEEKKILGQSIEGFFSIYALSGKDYKVLFKSLNEKCSRFEYLQQKEKELNLKRNELNKEISILKDKLSLFEMKYSFQCSSSTLSELDRIKKEEFRKRQVYEALSSNFEKQKAEKGMISFTVFADNDSYENIMKEKEELIRLQNSLDMQIEEQRECIRTMEEDVSILEDKKIEYQKLNEEYFVLSKTIDFIKESKESLKKDYIDPVKKSFDFYAKELSFDTSEMELNQDFDLSLIKDGSLRNIKHLSLAKLLYACYVIVLL